jgi:type IV pilus assembly protein PilN
MPRINLLPIKAARRADLARTELSVFGGLLLATVLGLAIWHHSTESDISDMQARIVDEQKDLGNLQKIVVVVEDFKKKNLLVERKLSAIQALKVQKAGPARLLSDLADILTKAPKVWLVSLEERDGLLSLKGGAMDQDNISEFQMALEQQSKFFHNVTLTLVSSAVQGTSAYFQWTITCRANYMAG